MIENNNIESTSRRIPFGKFVYKIDIKESMNQMVVGDEIRFRLIHAAYGNVYATSRRLRDESGKVFSVSLDTEGCYSSVKRIR